jgi:hypothetical protein
VNSRSPAGTFSSGPNARVLTALTAERSCGDSRNLLAVIDPANDDVIAYYPVGRCEGNHGMAVDPEHHLVFLSWEENALMTP